MDHFACDTAARYNVSVHGNVHEGCMSKFKRVTILDIAAQAGVSYQTVSRVINNRPDVAGETRERILKIIDQVGYRPNNVARSLVSNQTQTLGLLSNDFNDFFRTQVMTGADEEARRHGYAFVLWTVNLDEDANHWQPLLDRQVDGVFVASSNAEHRRHIQAMLRAGIPVIALGYESARERFSVVNVDNYGGGIQATQYLLERGHLRVTTIASPYGDHRTQGYRFALEQADIPFDDSLLERGDWGYESGYRAMKALLRRNPDLTAVFAQNDQMAIGALHALHEMGIRVPGDIAIVGFDDIPAAAHAWPPLTTVRQPMQEVGRLAARRLIESIQRPEEQEKEILLTTELIIRASA
jgi:LacI family transcriptional regulator